MINQMCLGGEQCRLQGIARGMSDSYNTNLTRRAPGFMESVGFESIADQDTELHQSDQRQCHTPE